MVYGWLSRNDSWQIRTVSHHIEAFSILFSYSQNVLSGRYRSYLLDNNFCRSVVQSVSGVAKTRTGVKCSPVSPNLTFEIIPSLGFLVRKLRGGRHNAWLHDCKLRINGVACPIHRRITPFICHFHVVFDSPVFNLHMLIIICIYVDILRNNIVFLFF